MIDYANNFAQGDTLVHVEAAFDPRQILPQGAAVAPAGIPLPPGYEVLFTSFWGRCATYLDTVRASLDLREPLATTFATRFYQNAAFAGGTDLLVWRDSLFNVSFGDERRLQLLLGPDLVPADAAAGRLLRRGGESRGDLHDLALPGGGHPLPDRGAARLGAAISTSSPESGWIYMNLNQVWPIPVHGPTVLAAQAWVTAVHSAEGRFSAGLPAIQLDSVCDFSSILIGPYPDYPVSETAYPWTYFFYSYYHYDE